MSNLSLTVQYAAPDQPPPPARWRVRSLLCSCLRALQAEQDDGAAGATAGEIGVRFVDEKESAALNKQYRGKASPTNVLSFAYPAEEGAADNNARLWGDIVICGAVVAREAQRYQKPVPARYAHIIVHGALHLAGFTHDSAANAAKMEAMERAILARHRIEDPYQ